MLQNGIQTVLTITVCPIIRKQHLTHEYWVNRCICSPNIHRRDAPRCVQHKYAYIIQQHSSPFIFRIITNWTHRGTSLQNRNDIFQFAVDTFEIRHHIFIFAKSLVLLPRVFINIGIHVFVCIGVLGIIYSTTIPSEIFCIIVEYL